MLKAAKHKGLIPYTVCRGSKPLPGGVGGQSPAAFPVYRRRRQQFSGPVGMLLLLLLFAPRVWGYEANIEEIVAGSTNLDSKISRAILEVHSSVFEHSAGEAPPEPEPGEEPLPEKADENEMEPGPIEQPDREFRQTIYWIRGKFLAVETFSMSGELLHFHLDESYIPLSFNISGERFFSDWDVLPSFLAFVEDSRLSWLEGAARWGVQPTGVTLVRSYKGRVLYDLYDSAGNSIWVDRSKMRPVRIVTNITGGGEKLVLTLEFSEFMIFGRAPEGVRGFDYPRTVNFMLDGELFKQNTLRSIRVNPSWRDFPLTRLRRKAAELAVQSAEEQEEGGES